MATTQTLLQTEEDWRELVGQWLKNVGNEDIFERTTSRPSQLEDVLRAELPDTEEFALSHLTLKIRDAVANAAQVRPAHYPCVVAWRFDHIGEEDGFYFDGANIQFFYKHD